jgi:hypothetical protein
MKRENRLPSEKPKGDDDEDELPTETSEAQPAKNEDD